MWNADNHAQCDFSPTSDASLSWEQRFAEPTVHEISEQISAPSHVFLVTGHEIQQDYLLVFARFTDVHRFNQSIVI